jgi:beta-lactamase regulating signal transducer with metallopeptidase domain
MSLVTGFPIVATLAGLILWLVFRLFPRISPDIRAWSWRLIVLKLAISAFAVGQVTLRLMPAIASQAEPTPISRTIPVQPMEQLNLAATLPAAKEEFRSATPNDMIPAAPNRSTRGSEARYDLLGAALWGLGVATFWAHALYVALRSRRSLRHGVPITDPEIVECLQTLSESSGLPQPPRLVCLDTVQGPMVCGIWQSMIVLPRRIASEFSEDLTLALGHEIAHIRRRDLAWTAIAWIVRSALFFNPVAWLAERELRAAQESATDQEAVWLTGASVTAYGKMLLRAMSPSRMAIQPSGLAMFDSFHNAQHRLSAMKHFSDRPGSFRKLAISAFVAVGIGCLPTYLLAPAVAAPGQAHKRTAKQNRSPHDTAGATQVPAFHSPTPLLKLATKPKLESIPPSPPVSPGISEKSRIIPPQAEATKPEQDIKFVEEQPGSNTQRESQSPDSKEAAKKALDEFNERVSQLISDQDARIAEYRTGADQREREAEQREREAQQRKRGGEWRARGVLLREQVIEANEKDGYRIVGEAQRAADAEQRRRADRQTEADQYQAVLDKKQRETDAWQRKFDNETIAAMKQETQKNIAAARSKYQERIAELVADDLNLRHEAAGAAAYTAARAKLVAGSRLHDVRAGSGLSFAIPDGYQVVRVQANGKDSYTVVLRHKKS